MGVTGWMKEKQKTVDRQSNDFDQHLGDSSSRLKLCAAPWAQLQRLPLRTKSPSPNSSTIPQPPLARHSSPIIHFLHSEPSLNHKYKHPHNPTIAPQIQEAVSEEPERYALIEKSSDSSPQTHGIPPSYLVLLLGLLATPVASADSALPEYGYGE